MTATASLLLGALLGAVNAGAAAWTARRSLALDPERGMRFVLSGMAARMGVILLAFGLVLAFVPVQRGAFVIGLGVLFALGLIAEVALVLGRAPHSPADA